MFCKYHQFEKHTPQVWSVIIVTKQSTVVKLDQQLTQATS